MKILFLFKTCDTRKIMTNILCKLHVGLFLMIIKPQHQQLIKFNGDKRKLLDYKDIQFFFYSFMN